MLTSCSQEQLDWSKWWGQAKTNTGHFRVGALEAAAVGSNRLALGSIADILAIEDNKNENNNKNNKNKYKNKNKKNYNKFF